MVDVRQGLRRWWLAGVRQRRKIERKIERKRTSLRGKERNQEGEKIKRKRKKEEETVMEWKLHIETKRGSEVHHITYGALWSLFFFFF